MRNKPIITATDSTAATLNYKSIQLDEFNLTTLARYGVSYISGQALFGYTSLMAALGISFFMPHALILFAGVFLVNFCVDSSIGQPKINKFIKKNILDTHYYRRRLLESMLLDSLSSSQPDEEHSSDDEEQSSEEESGEVVKKNNALAQLMTIFNQEIKNTKKRLKHEKWNDEAKNRLKWLNACKQHILNEVIQQMINNTPSKDRTQKNKITLSFKSTATEDFKSPRNRLDRETKSDTESDSNTEVPNQLIIDFDPTLITRFIQQDKRNRRVRRVIKLMTLFGCVGFFFGGISSMKAFIGISLISKFIVGSAILTTITNPIGLGIFIGIALTAYFAWLAQVVIDVFQDEKTKAGFKKFKEKFKSGSVYEKISVILFGIIGAALVIGLSVLAACNLWWGTKNMWVNILIAGLTTIGEMPFKLATLILTTSVFQNQKKTDVETKKPNVFIRILTAIALIIVHEILDVCKAIKKAWQTESTLEFLNPFRFLDCLIRYVVGISLFWAHFIASGLTGDRFAGKNLPNVGRGLLAALNTASDMTEDIGQKFNSTTGHGGGHSHNHNGLAEYILFLGLCPIKLASGLWILMSRVFCQSWSSPKPKSEASKTQKKSGFTKLWHCLFNGFFGACPLYVTPSKKAIDITAPEAIRTSEPKQPVSPTEKTEKIFKENQTDMERAKEDQPATRVFRGFFDKHPDSSQKLKYLSEHVQMAVST